MPADNTLALHASSIDKALRAAATSSSRTSAFPPPTWTRRLRHPTPPGRTRPERAADGDGARAPGRHRIADARGAPTTATPWNGSGPRSPSATGCPSAFDTLRVAPIEVKAVVLSIADADGESAVSSSARRRRTTRRSPRSSAKRSTATARKPSRRRSPGPKGGRSCTSRPATTALQDNQRSVRSNLGPVIAEGPRCEPRRPRGRGAPCGRRGARRRCAAATLDSAGLPQEVLERVVDSMAPLIEQLERAGQHRRDHAELSCASRITRRPGAISPQRSTSQRGLPLGRSPNSPPLRRRRAARSRNPHQAGPAGLPRQLDRRSSM